MKKCACRKESCLARKRPKLGNTVLLAPSEFLRIFALAFFGEMSEWSNEHAWKVCILETVSRVRIPLSPLAQKENQKQDEKEFWVWFSFFLTSFSFLDELNKWSNMSRITPKKVLILETVRGFSRLSRDLSASTERESKTE